MSKPNTVAFEGTAYEYTLERQKPLARPLYGDKPNTLMRACAKFLGAEVCGEFRRSERAALYSLTAAMRREHGRQVDAARELERLAAWNSGAAKVVK